MTTRTPIETKPSPVSRGKIRFARQMAILLPIPIIFVLLTGCRNIYSRTQTGYSPDPCKRFQQRLHEASNAQKRAETAAAGFKSDADATLDKLETTALDFRRLLVAARETAKDCPDAQRFAESLDTMEARSRSLLDLVAQARNAAAAK